MLIGCQVLSCWFFLMFVVVFVSACILHFLWYFLRSLDTNIATDVEAEGIAPVVRIQAVTLRLQTICVKAYNFYTKTC